MIQDSRKNPSRHPSTNDSSLSNAPPLHKISSKSVRTFLRYFVQNHTDIHRHTEYDECATSSAEVLTDQLRKDSRIIQVIDDNQSLQSLTIGASTYT